MTGKIVFWNPAQKWGRVKADTEYGGETYYFAQRFTANGFRDHKFTRSERVEFRGDQTVRGGRVAYAVKPLVSPAQQ